MTKVDEGPSILVKSRPDYSPQDLHQFAFRVWLEGEQPLDLLAYTSDYYYMWTVGIKALLQMDDAGVSSRDDHHTGEQVDHETKDTGNDHDETISTLKISSDGLKKGLELM